MLYPLDEKTIVDVGEEHNIFIQPEEVLKANALGFHFVQVDTTEKYLIYRDGLLYRQLGPGPHYWWNGFMHKWKMQRINMRIEMLPLSIKGRVKGPPMPQDVPGAAAVDFACDVTTEIELVCKLAEINTFLQYSKPLSVFYAIVRDMTIEMIGKLPYDQYGNWATQLRNYIKERLTSMGSEGAERRMGIRVEDIYVKSFKPNTAHDRNMIANYQLVERVRRELTETQAEANRDIVKANALNEQAKQLNISPALLALKDSSTIISLIEADAGLRKLMIASGLNPGINTQPIQNSAVNIQPLQNPSGQLNAGQTDAFGYLDPAPRQNSTPVTPIGPVSGPLYPNQSQQSSTPFDITQPLTTSGPLPASTASTPAAGWESEPVDAARQVREIEALNQNGFEVAGSGQVTPLRDQYGQAIGREWVLMASVERPNGFLTIIFHCPAGYPASAPSIQIRNATNKLTSVEPNTIRDWHPGHMLIDIAQEIDNDLP